MITAFYEFVDELHFQPVDNMSVYGDLDGCATKVTVLNSDPLSLMFAFYVGSSTGELPQEWEPLPDAEKIETSLEDGFVWLTFWNLINPTGPILATTARQFVMALKAAGFTGNSQCGLCLDQNVELTLVDGRAVRICAQCLESKQREADNLNHPDTGHFALIPLGILGAALAWTTEWLVLDFFIEWLNAGQAEQGLEINKLTLIPIIGSGFLLFILGAYLGELLWKSGVSRRAPLLLSIIAISIAVLLGELLYMTISLWRQIGIFDVKLATNLFVLWLLTYSVGWIVLKVCILACLLVGCWSGSGKHVSTSVA